MAGVTRWLQRAAGAVDRYPNICSSSASVICSGDMVMSSSWSGRRARVPSPAGRPVTAVPLASRSGPVAARRTLCRASATSRTRPRGVLIERGRCRAAQRAAQYLHRDPGPLDGAGRLHVHLGWVNRSSGWNSRAASDAWVSRLSGWNRRAASEAAATTAPRHRHRRVGSD